MYMFLVIMPDNATCVMGSDFTHPLIAGLMGQIMGGLGSDPSSYTLMPWYTNGEADLPVIDNGTLMAQGKAMLGFQFHPLVQQSLSSTEDYGIDYLNVPWRTVNETDVPITTILPNMTEDGKFYYANAVGGYTTDISQAVLGNLSDVTDPSTCLLYTS